MSSKTYVPDEIFTTMRYEGLGIALEDLCSPLPSLSQHIRKQNIIKEKERFLLLERHVARLQMSLQAMKRKFPLEWDQCRFQVEQHEMERELELAVLSKSEGACSSSRRLRVSVDKTGKLKVITFDLKQKDSIVASQTVRLDLQSIDEQKTPEIFYRYKTSHREMYDSARLRVNANLGSLAFPSNTSSPTKQIGSCFDVLMIQKTGQNHQKSYITESSIANVLLYLHETSEIITPSSITGLHFLPGIFRQELLERGLVKEQNISVDRLMSDLKANRATLYLCNALRGIIPVTLLE